jgi:hypothetical protein
MNKGTCKFYNGDFHNERCEAGVLYRDVTTDPDLIDGSAFRKPCIDWDEFNRQHGRPFDNEAQKENWAKCGHCNKREEPSAEEITAWKAESDAHIAEIVAAFSRGETPSGVIVCGPRNKTCACNCPISCEHVWEGEVINDETEGISTVTCSRCGKWQMNHDV